MATATETMTGREYRRVSSDKSGEGRSVDEQGIENAEAADERHRPRRAVRGHRVGQSLPAQEP